MPGGIVVRPIIKEDLNLGTGKAIVPAPTGGEMVGRQINLASFGLQYSQAWTPGVVTENGVFLDLNIPGARPGNLVLCSHTGIGQLRLNLSGTVTADDTVRIIMNVTDGFVTPNAGTLRVVVFQIP